MFQPLQGVLCWVCEIARIHAEEGRRTQTVCIKILKR